MYDKNKPYNKLPLLPAKFDFKDVDILLAVPRAYRELSNLNGQLLAAYSNYSNSYLFIDPLFTPEAVASSGVENIVTTTKEVLEAKVLPKKEQTEAQKETINYEEALQLGQEKLDKKGFLSTNDFINMQRIIAPEKVGVRDLPGYKVMNEETGEIYYSPPEGVTLIRSLLKNFEDYFNQDMDDIDPSIKVAILHYQFEAIHPFKDGNGRTGRILMPLYLTKTETLSFPVLFISGFILKHRNQYYRLIRNVTAKNDWKPWVLFILRAIEEQSGKTWYALREIRILEHNYKEKLRKINFRRLDLIEAIFINPVFDVSQLAEALGVHTNTAKKYIDILLKKKMVTVQRHKNSKLYYNYRMLNLIQDSQ